jgi:lysyl oxidase
LLSPTRVAVVLVIAIAAASPLARGSSAPEREASASALDKNPCLERATRRELRCPDLQMAPPENLYLTRTRSGRLRLHAGNSINSMGEGPAELRGRRASRWTMDAKQAIYKKGGGHIMLNTGARLVFKAIPGQYRYWKYFHAARFELWKLDKQGRRTTRVEVGPKVSYCLRDLQHRNPQLPGSPRKFHYPGCSQDPGAQRDTLGTSVGWSDVYPSTYHEQWINVNHRRGCFAYVHVADPKNHIYESNEKNNEGETIVRLPWRGSGRQGCPGESKTGGPDGGAQAPNGPDPYGY